MKGNSNTGIKVTEGFSRFPSCLRQEQGLIPILINAYKQGPGRKTPGISSTVINEVPLTTLTAMIRLWKRRALVDER